MSAAAQQLVDAPRERGILFSAPMVRRLLDDSKTQTRRVVTKKQALDWLEPGGFTPDYVADPGNHLCPYGVPGDRLWVRETWAVPPGSTTRGDVVYRAEVGDVSEERSVRRLTGRALVPWLPSIHMPRWASRITLEVTGVRVEHLQDITEADAIAEGVRVPVSEDGKPWLRITGPHLPHEYLAKHPKEWTSADWMRTHYAALWDSINGARPGKTHGVAKPYAWAANPWVWTITFRRLTP